MAAGTAAFKFKKKASRPNNPVRRAPARRKSWFSEILPRANGGPVMPGQVYLVGESGAELLTTSAPGRIQTIPGGTGRAAKVSRAPGRGFAALARNGNSRFGKSLKKVVVGAVWGGGAFAVAEILDKAGISSIVQGGIFAGVAIGLAALGQTAGAVGVAAIGLYEMLAAGWKLLGNQFPSLRTLSIPGFGNDGSGTPPPTPAPAAG